MRTAVGPRVRDHFTKTAASVAATYAAVLAAARALGPVSEDPKKPPTPFAAGDKTSILLNRRTAFAGVATQKSALVLTLKFDREVKSRRVKRIQQTSARRWHLEVRLDAPEQVDRELRGWIARAYQLAE